MLRQMCAATTHPFLRTWAPSSTAPHLARLIWWWTCWRAAELPRDAVLACEFSFELQCFFRPPITERVFFRELRSMPISPTIFFRVERHVLPKERAIIHWRWRASRVPWHGKVFCHLHFQMPMGIILPVPTAVTFWNIARQRSANHRRRSLTFHSRPR